MELRLVPLQFVCRIVVSRVVVGRGVRKSTLVHVVGTALLAARLLVLATGCGDGQVFVVINTGVIVSEPRCTSARSGEIDVLDQSGLLVIVAIDEGTAILLFDGSPGTCADLSVGAHVRVRGSDGGGPIGAREIRVTSPQATLFQKRGSSARG